MAIRVFWKRTMGEGREWTAGVHHLRKVPELCPNAYSLLCDMEHGIHLLWVLVSLWKSNQPACIRPLSCVLLVCFGVTFLLEDQKWGSGQLRPLSQTWGLRLPGCWAWVIWVVLLQVLTSAASHLSKHLHSLCPGCSLLTDTLPWVSAGSSVI